MSHEPIDTIMDLKNSLELTKQQLNSQTTAIKNYLKALDIKAQQASSFNENSAYSNSKLLLEAMLEQANK